VLANALSMTCVRGCAEDIYIYIYYYCIFDVMQFFFFRFSKIMFFQRSTVNAISLEIFQENFTKKMLCEIFVFDVFNTKKIRERSKCNCPGELSGKYQSCIFELNIFFIFSKIFCFQKRTVN